MLTECAAEHGEVRKAPPSTDLSERTVGRHAGDDFTTAPLEPLDADAAGNRRTAGGEDTVELAGRDEHRRSDCAGRELGVCEMFVDVSLRRPYECCTG